MWRTLRWLAWFFGLAFYEWVENIYGHPVFFVMRVLDFLGRRVDIHKFVGADAEECFHTHPATAIRVVLYGSYIEEVLHDDGRREYVEWTPGMVGIVRPEFCHRIEEVDSPCYTLWLRGKITHKIRVVGAGWERQVPVHGAEQ